MPYMQDDGPVSEAQTPLVHDDGVAEPDGQTGAVSWRALLVVGLTLASAGVAFAIVRGMMRQPPPDPTTERIQTLIDEANRLLKQLDDQKRA